MWIVSTDLMRLLVDRNIAGYSRSGCLHEHARNATLGKTESERRASLGRRHLHPKVVALTGVKGNPVIVGSRRLGTVFERQFTAIRCCAQCAGLRHDRDITVISHPDRRLMC